MNNCSHCFLLGSHWVSTRRLIDTCTSAADIPKNLPQCRRSIGREGIRSTSTLHRLTTRQIVRHLRSSACRASAVIDAFHKPLSTLGFPMLYQKQRGEDPSAVNG